MTTREKAVDGAMPDVPLKPEPSREEKVRSLEALRRYASLPRPVTASMQTGEDGSRTIGPAHSDELGWAVRLVETMGASSTGFALTQARHLANVAAESETNAESSLNSMLAAVAAAKPENEIEAQLAVQMAATHQTAMRCLSRATQGATPEIIEALGNLANKLLRTSVKQSEAFAKIRRGGEQKVTVEHVHVYEGGQAIVGSVTTGAPALGRGAAENGRQPHALTGTAALAFSPVAPVLREDAGGDRVPVAGREGEGAVPDARRRTRGRRAQG